MTQKINSRFEHPFRGPRFEVSWSKCGCCKRESNGKTMRLRGGQHRIAEVPTVVKMRLDFNAASMEGTLVPHLWPRNSRFDVMNCQTGVDGIPVWRRVLNFINSHVIFQHPFSTPVLSRINSHLNSHIFGKSTPAVALAKFQHPPPSEFALSTIATWLGPTKPCCRRF